MSSSSSVEEFSLSTKASTSGTESDLVLSMAKVYRLKASHLSTPPCDNISCKMKGRFVLANRVPCKSVFKCTKLKDNACGDFGLLLEYLGGPYASITMASAYLCREGEEVKQALEPGNSLMISFWYTLGSTFDVNCFFWCTPDGVIPAKSPALTPTALEPLNIVLQKLQANDQAVRLMVKEVALQSGLLQSLDVSPYRLYRLTMTHLNATTAAKNAVSTAGPNVAVAEVVFKWKRPTSNSCRFTFVCTQLTGNACGDFGVSLSSGGPTGLQEPQTRDVCHPNVTHRGELFSSDQNGKGMSVGLWYVVTSTGKPAMFNATCYFWCTEDGALPAARIFESGQSSIESIVRAQGQLLRDTSSVGSVLLSVRVACRRISGKSALKGHRDAPDSPQNRLTGLGVKGLPDKPEHDHGQLRLRGFRVQERRILHQVQRPEV